jgi:HlyD family secretion protein
MKSNAVFRKVSLDRLSSPEQLDQLLSVTDRRGWIALAAMGAVLAAGLVWGVLGSIPQNVRGTGILVKTGGVLEVIPVAGGLITDVSVNVGETVTEGQTILIVEAMKTMNQIVAPRAGKVTLILVDDGQPVEYGEPLAIIE